MHHRRTIVARAGLARYLAGMPTLAFFPWAQLAEPVDVGRFSLIPMAVAEKSGAVPAKLVAAVHSVLAPYQARPNAKLDRVPLLHRIGTDVCGELDDDAAADLFAFRTRLAFAALASRDFFASSSYCNSDNFQLVAQGFSTDNAATARFAIWCRRHLDTSSVPITSRRPR
jgi:hypothetical protein